MIILFTDFGTADPYVGQMHIAIHRHAPEVPVIDLMHSVPCFNIKAGAFLLPAYTRNVASGSVVVAVVDPGVGGDRKPLMIHADGCWYVGPDNGLFLPLMQRCQQVEVRQIDWQPEFLSNSFHGRDLFAPVAAMLARGTPPLSSPVTPYDPGGLDEQLYEVIYIDHYGNAITGVEAGSAAQDATLTIAQQSLQYARTFAEVAPGQCFWYENANGLVEVACNQAAAASQLNLKIGDPVRFR